MITAPAMMRYLGCTLAATRPTTNIIAMVTTPPGEEHEAGPGWRL